MFSLTVSQHFMIAHSFRGAVFGPAQALHGATYAVEASFLTDRLDEDGLIVDIGQAGELLSRVLSPLNYRNLDEMPRFAGQNTTTEYLALAVFEDLKAEILTGALGKEALNRLHGLRVTLRESPTAWATYEGSLVLDR
ncbi:MAG: 6-carboxytetrahydropterin synthase [Pseudomonadota bacterium]|nr:6-carboxytetrahydropterin synthase [Pseudomonadota bacterium]